MPEHFAAEVVRHQRAQSERHFAHPWPLHRWPDVHTRVVIGTRDRLFPPTFQRRIVRDRLGVDPAEKDSGHLPTLARPAELAARLLRWGADG